MSDPRRLPQIEVGEVLRPARTATILVVNDDLRNLEQIVTIIRQAGYRALEAADGPEALALARSEKPDLIICDVLMPTMDGFEFVTRLHADPALAAIEVIFYIAYYHRHEALTLAGKCGVRRVLTRPTAPGELLGAIEQCLDGTAADISKPEASSLPREQLRLVTEELSDKVAELQRTNERLVGLNEISLQLSSEHDPAALLRMVARAARDLIGAKYAFLCLKDPRHAEGTHFAASGLDGATVQALERPRIDAVMFARVMGERHSRRWSKASGEPMPVEFPSGYPPVNSALASPIVSRMTEYGWICVVDKLGSENFGDDDEQVLANLGAGLGRNYESSALYAEVKRTADQLETEIAEHKKSAEALAEAELRTRQVAENISEVFYLVDPMMTHMLYVSPAYEKIWGRSCASLYADPKSFAASILPEDAQRVMAEYAPAGVLVPSDVEYRIRRPDGDIRSIRARTFPIGDASGATYRFAGIAQDVTAERRVTDALRESERRFSAMLASVQMVAIMLDCEAHVTYCNDYLLRLLGRRRDEVIGHDWLEFLVPGEIESLKECCTRPLGEPPAWHHESEIVTRTGERPFIQWSNSILRSSSGEVVGTASLGVDITARRKAEEKVRRLNADLELRVAERTAELQAANQELEAFDYSVSHDLRAPLNRIQALGGLLLEDFGDRLGAEGKATVQRIRRASEEMDRLVRDLLQLSMVTKGDLHRTRVDVSDLARLVFDALRATDPARKVTFVLAAGLTARADWGLARIALENLLGNAWKFSALRTHPRIEFGSSRIEGANVFFVKDDGAGFDGTQAERIFEPFRRLTTQGEFKGTGIGLATVARIVRRHGGRAWAEGVEGSGATVYFTLSA